MILKATQIIKNLLLVTLILGLGTPTMPLRADQEIPQETQEEAVETTPNSTEEAQSATLELPSFGSVMRWGIGGGFVGLQGAITVLVQYNSDFFTKLINKEPLTPENQKVAHDTLVKLGIDPESITVISNAALPGTPAAAMGSNVIMINQNEAKNYTKEEMEFILGHEVAHLQQNHMLKRGILMIALPFIAHYGLKAWDAAVHKVLIAVKNKLGVTKNSKADRAINTIDAINHWISNSCITKALVIGAGVNMYSRYAEKQADIASVTTLNNHLAAESTFKKCQEKHKLERAKSPLFERFITPEGDNVYEGSHPRPSERIAYTRNCLATT